MNPVPTYPKAHPRTAYHFGLVTRLLGKARINRFHRALALAKVAANRLQANRFASDEVDYRNELITRLGKAD